MFSGTQSTYFRFFMESEGLQEIAQCHIGNKVCVITDIILDSLYHENFVSFIIEYCEKSGVAIDCIKYKTRSKDRISKKFGQCLHKMNWKSFVYDVEEIEYTKVISQS